MSKLAHSCQETMDEIEYNNVMWYDIDEWLDPVRCAAYVPHRLRPTWEEVVKFKLLREDV